MEEIIVIRAADPDGSVFKAVVDALRGKRAESAENYIEQLGGSAAAQPEDGAAEGSSDAAGTAQGEQSGSEDTSDTGSEDSEE